VEGRKELRLDPRPETQRLETAARQMMERKERRRELKAWTSRSWNGHPWGGREDSSWNGDHRDRAWHDDSERHHRGMSPTDVAKNDAPSGHASTRQKKKRAEPTEEDEGNTGLVVQGRATMSPETNGIFLLPAAQERPPILCVEHSKSVAHSSLWSFAHCLMDEALGLDNDSATFVDYDWAQRSQVQQSVKEALAERPDAICSMHMMAEGEVKGELYLAVGFGGNKVQRQRASKLALAFTIAARRDDVHLRCDESDTLRGLLKEVRSAYQWPTEGKRVPCPKFAQREVDDRSHLAVYSTRREAAVQSAKILVEDPSVKTRLRGSIARTEEGGSLPRSLQKITVSAASVAAGKMYARKAAGKKSVAAAPPARLGAPVGGPRGSVAGLVAPDTRSESGSRPCSTSDSEAMADYD